VVRPVDGHGLARRKARRAAGDRSMRPRASGSAGSQRLLDPFFQVRAGPADRISLGEPTRQISVHHLSLDSQLRGP
jgi:hypothetical protein